MEPLIAGVAVFVLTFAVLSIAEKIIHKATHNPDKSYTVGVWVFATLAGMYAFLTSLGR